MFVLTCLVTEREVRRGINNASQSRDHCLAYIRHIENVNMSSFKSAQFFIDMVKTASRIEIDSEASSLLYDLREVLLPSRLPETNITHFSIEWVGNQGLDYNSHAAYLHQFGETFYNQVTVLITSSNVLIVARYILSANCSLQQSFCVIYLSYSIIFMNAYLKKQLT
jgi:hypothetical protein